MKNGKVYEGKIINQSREKIQVELDNKQVLVLDKKDIKRIRYTPSKEELERKRKEEKKQQATLVPPKKPLISRQNSGISFETGPSSYKSALVKLLTFYSLISTIGIGIRQIHASSAHF
ncbi:MAG: hypothetical protein NZ853_01340 [Leptospiraceae bacterium]|nr:hypothetical protein [Leptospiraceae bacterium]MDW7976128.1 hypothetical protein [Leptospiraceae bacterium]